MSNRKEFTAFAVSKPSPNQTASLTRAGVGYVNDDGSISILLNVLPTNGQLRLVASSCFSPAFTRKLARA